MVVNYGIGGHYMSHYDPFDMRNRREITDGSYAYDDRIATCMLYLNRVKAGGSTIFPKLDIVAHPIKGSAVLWYNLLPSGEVDYRSQHASCPVLLGTKWTTMKLMRERGHEFRRPCKTHPMGEHF